jgi:hypothetical protein
LEGLTFCAEDSLTYQEQLTTHLSGYRKNVLKVEHCGVFNYKGRDLPKEHILPADQKWLNIPDGVRESVKAFVERPPRIRLHQYFHHLNSSQAFTLNLFVPFFEGGPPTSTALLEALGTRGSLSGWKLEEVRDSEEQTNIDVSWSLVTGERYICEVKLSEADFGTAERDEKHLDKLKKTYAPVLKGQIDKKLLNSEAFFKNYQILRLAWCAVKEPTTTLMFLLPQANQKLWVRLPKVLDDFSKELRSRTRIVAMEDVLEELSANPGLSPELKEHVRTLQEKYVLPGHQPA